MVAPMVTHPPRYPLTRYRAEVMSKLEMHGYSLESQSSRQLQTVPLKPFYSTLWPLKSIYEETSKQESFQPIYRYTFLPCIIFIRINSNSQDFSSRIHVYGHSTTEYNSNHRSSNIQRMFCTLLSCPSTQPSTPTRSFPLLTPDLRNPSIHPPNGLHRLLCHSRPNGIPNASLPNRHPRHHRNRTNSIHVPSLPDLSRLWLARV